MNTIEQTIKDFLKKFGISDKKYTYLVAFSGGYDSMCLLNALHNICDNKIIALHLNHNWRGDESDREEQNCKDFCVKIGVEFYSEKLSSDIPHTETAARNARYDFFEKCAKKFGSNIIFTAHNKNDNAETLIYRIAHGTGIKGLQGIAEKREIFYRPLLTIDRKAIEKYCKDNNLHPNNDSSNSNTDYKRNFIRLKILPEFEQICPDILNKFSVLSKNAKDDTEIINDYIRILKNKICKNGKYDTQKFLNLSKALQMRVLYELVTPLFPQDYDRERISVLSDFILKNKSSKSGKICSVTTNYELFVSENFFELIKREEKRDLYIKINSVGEYENDGIIVIISECDSLPDRFDSKTCRTLYADFSSINFDFEIRTRQDGDIIQPLGMEGHQKLKKYLNSKKIPNHEKDDLILLTQGKEVLWIAGVGLSDKIKVKSKPTHKIEIRRK